MRVAADTLAHAEWPRLYDEEVLRANNVPVAAVVCADDMYVERASTGNGSSGGSSTWRAAGRKVSPRGI